MLTLNLRIGTKLAVSAAVAVVLVTGTIINQARINSVTDGLDRQVRLADAMQKKVLEAEIETRRILMFTRDIRLALSDKDLQYAVDRVKTYTTHGNKALQSAAALAVEPGDKQVLAEAIEQFNAQSTVTLGLAERQKQLMEARDRFANEGRDWPKTSAALMAAAEATHSPAKAEIIRKIEHADGHFKQARTAAWSAIARQDSSLLPRVKDLIELSVRTMREAQALSSDTAINTAIDQLLPLLSPFNEAFKRVMEMADGQANYIRERNDPIRAKMDESLAQLKTGLTKRADEASNQSDAAESRGFWVNLFASVAVILFLIGSAIFSGLNIGRPIRRIAQVLMELASGNKAIDIPYGGRADEIGEAARAAQAFKDNLVRMERMEAEQKETQAISAAERKRDMQTLADKFEAAIGKVVDTVSTSASQLESAAGTLTQTAEETQRLSGMVSNASEHASSNVRSVSTAAEELGSSVGEISRQVQESSRIAQEAVHQASRTDERITELSSAAARIGDVVKLITAIAEQTNLLALNATIEAARAGDAGRGFAVVAQEVKALAAQTAKATDEIGTQIASMQTATQVSVTAIKEIGGTIGRISEISSAIAAAVEEQGAATQEIARNVQQAAQGTAEVASNIGDVNRGASETGSASSQVLASAQALSSEGGKLKHEVQSFLASVRAA